MAGTTPIYGFPYPESSDLVANYPALGQQLAEDVEDVLAAGIGKVLQVVTTIKTDRFTTTSGSLVDITGYLATITPSSATSKILVMSSFHYSNSVNTAYGRLVLLRDSTQIGLGNSSGSGTRVTAGSQIGNSTDPDATNVGYNILDSPATTSAVTYKWQVFTYNGRTFTFNGSTGTTDSNRLNTSSTIILMEVSA